MALATYRFLRLLLSLPRPFPLASRDDHHGPLSSLPSSHATCLLHPLFCTSCHANPPAARLVSCLCVCARRDRVCVVLFSLSLSLDSFLRCFIKVQCYIRSPFLHSLLPPPLISFGCRLVEFCIVSVSI
jgi:hypothetical protein